MLTSSRPKFGTQIVPVVQELTEYKRLAGKNAAFRQWQQKLKRGEKLPRGKFFKGKKAGKPLFIMDEAWLLISKN
tara:strand:- start:51 stop:275 length:225 start_codon:yes stop_codon:yes gene_type:complete